MKNWIKEILSGKNNISPDYLCLFKLFDSKEEVMECIDHFYGNINFKPNF